MKKSLHLLILVVLLTPAIALAGEGHEECSLCHGAHTAVGPGLLTEKPNTTTTNPATGKPLERMEQICMACHAAEPDGLGYRPVKMGSTHPCGMKPKKVILPDSAKGFKGQEEELTCMGCHDPHPSNTNYMYLRGPKVSAGNTQAFCIWCHPVQAGSASTPKASSAPTTAPTQKK
jgi:predicted CXXCH cytochrome family protein